jgi:predicted phage tail protein
MNTVVENYKGGFRIVGSKGKGGGGGRAPVEARDSLHSVTYAAVLDLLSEGEIEGPVDGLKNVLLDGTPVENADGTLNFSDVTIDYRSGTVDQDYIKGFPTVEATTVIGVELKHGTPWVRSVTNKELSAVRITLGTNGLSKANTSNGDISGYTVAYLIELQTDGGAWETVIDSSLTGKTTSTYRRTHRIDLPKATTGWMVRVTRTTPDANSSTIADGTLIDNFAEVIDAKLRYPNSALMGIRVDAQQFRSVPTRASRMRGRRVRVPVNYDPVARTYTGVWNGQFKIAYTNNPAWVFYDLATHKRYGLGKLVNESLLNKGALYQIGAYCDELVSDGKGGVEPRFTCNVYLQKDADAYKVLQDLVSIFRGMTYWSSSAIETVADMPRDPVYNYNQTNVVGGRFSYSGTDIEQRYTVAVVSYNDMTDLGRQKIAYVQDAEGIRRYGVNKVEITAFGCTSEAQAQRMGQWALMSSKFETQTVVFTVDRSGQLVTPGKIVKIMDSAFAGKRLGGRIVSATENSIVLDKPVDVVIGDVVTVNLPSGIAASRYIQSTTTVDGVQTIVADAGFGATPVPGANWCVDTDEVASREFSILSVKDNGDGTFAVTALQHERQKFAFIDNGTKVDPKPVTIIPPGVQAAPASITIQPEDRVAADGTASVTITLSWPSVENAVRYGVEWNRSNAGWVRMPTTQLREVEVNNVFAGDYVARVRAISARDIPSVWTESAVTTITVNAKPPRNYDIFTVQELPGGVRRFNFEYTTMDPPPDLAGAEIRYLIGHPETFTWEDMTPLDAGYYTSAFNTTQPEAGTWTFACRARNRSGKLSEGMLVRQVILEENFNQERVPDLTPPPEPTGFAGFVGLSVATLYTDLPAYTVGHGHKTTKFYYAEVVQGQPLPTFSSATLAAETPGTHGTATVEIGKTYLFWATWTSVDGIESAHTATPVTIAAGKVGDADLSDDLDLAAKLADGSISGSKLAAEAIDATKFANSIQPVTIWTGSSLPATKTTDNLTWEGKLYTWDGTTYVLPPAGELADGSVTAQKIAAGAVDAAKIAAGVELVKIWSGGSLPTTSQGSVLSWNGKLYRWDGTKYSAEVATADLTGQIDSTKLADNAVTVSKIAAGAVEAGKLATNAVTSDKIAAGAVNVAKFASGIEPVTVVSGSTLPTVKTTETITFQGKLYRWSGTAYTSAVPTADLTGTISSGQIAAGAVDATKFASSIEPVTLATGASLPTTKTTTVISWNGKLYRWDGTKYTAEVVVGDIVGQIAATQIADNAITTPKLAANAVVAGKIAANAVTAGTVAADAITAGKIAAGAVNTRELAAGSVTAGKLVVTATDTVNVDPFFQDADMWANANFTRKVVEGAPGPNVLATSIATSMQVPAAYMTPIDTSKTYLFETWFIATAAQTNRAFASIRFYDANGALLTGADAPNPGAGWPGTNASSGNFYFPAVSAVTPTTWTRTALTVGPNGVAQFPPKAAYFTAGAYLNYGSAAPIVESQWGGFRVTEMARGELIVDGAVTADKVAANAITANSIAAGAVTAGKIAANAVTANEIAANSVTTAKIAAGAVTAAEIAARAITADKLVISSTTNLIPDTADWNIAGNATSWLAAGFGRNTVDPSVWLQHKTITTLFTTFEIQKGSTYLFNVDLKSQTANSSQVFELVDVNGNQFATRLFIGNFVVPSANVFASYSATLTAPASVVVRLKVFAQDNQSTNVGGYLWIRNPVLRPMAAGELIVDGAVTAAKIAANTITATHIAAGTITATELGANSVTAGKIAAGSVTATELASNSVTATQLAANSVVAGKIAANAITAGTIAANAVTTATIAAGAVTATELAAGSVVASKMVLSDTSNAYPDFDMQDDSGYSSTTSFSFASANSSFGGRRVILIPASSAATADATVWAYPAMGFQVEPNSQYLVSMQSARQAASAATLQIVTRLGSKTSNSAVTWDAEVVQNSDTAASAGVYKTFEIATGTRQRMQIGFRLLSGAATGGYFGSITVRRMNGANLIVDGAITAGKIAANAVTATAIAANAVTAGAIAANAVTAGKIAANAVTAGTIAAGAVSADQIAANAITASKLVVADRSNMLSDTEFKDLVYWYTNMVTSTDAAAVAALNCSPVMANVAGSTSNTELYNRAKEYFMSVEPGRAYRVTIDVYIAAGWNGRGQLNLQGYTSNGSTGTTSVNAYTTDYRTTPAAAATTVSLEFDYTATATTAFVRFRFLAVYTNAAAAGLFIGNPRVRLKQDSALIVDGAITANKIAANAIAVGTAAIQDGAIVNAHIGNLSADKINAGTLNAARIGAGSIDVTKLAANSVTATQLAANAVTADKVSAGAITVDKLAANSVTAVKIAASTITADKLSVTTLSAIAANMGTVTAGRIQNAANTSYWNLSATGATTMFKLGNDLTYDETNGLQLNKLNVIGEAQLAPGSITEVFEYGDSATYTIWRNNTFNVIRTIPVSEYQVSILEVSGLFKFLLNVSQTGVAQLKVSVYRRSGGTVSYTLDLGATTSGSTELSFRLDPLILPGKAYQVELSVRSTADSPPDAAYRYVRNVSITLNSIKR